MEKNEQFMKSNEYESLMKKSEQFISEDQYKETFGTRNKFEKN